MKAINFVAILVCLSLGVVCRLEDNKMWAPEGDHDHFLMERFKLPEDCGQNYLDPGTEKRRYKRVANGFVFYRYYIPSVVQLISIDRTNMTKGNETHSCSGTLIKTNLVLTAAHCVENQTDIWVMAGTKRYSSAEVGWFDYEARHKLRHYCTPPSKDRDIAYLVLRDHIELSTSVQPVCLDLNSSNPIFDGKAYSAGYGIIDHPKIFPDWPIGLEVVKEDCNWYNQEYGSCWSSYLDGKLYGSWCGGDSGGPVVVMRDNRQYLYGIIKGGSQHSCEPGILTMEHGYTMDVHKNKDILIDFLRAKSEEYNVNCRKAQYLEPDVVSQSKYPVCELDEKNKDGNSREGL